MILKHVETKISRHEQFILCWVKLEWFLSRCCLPLSLCFCALLFERWWKIKKKQTFRTPFTGWFCVLLVLGQEKSLLSPNVATRPSITVCLTLREALWNSVMKVQRGSRKVNPVPNEYNFFFNIFWWQVIHVNTYNLFTTGGFLEFSTATNATILKPCSTGMYQPNGRWSNESTPFCTKKMSACDGIGEVVCDDGNVTSDRRCRCDNADDWAMESYIQENPLNTSCVLPSQNNFVCVKFKCPPGQELDPSYKCVNKCQEGYHRPFGSFLCLPFTGNR